MAHINDLADDAVIQIYPISPALSAVDAEHLEESLAKLFLQFEREQNVAAALASCLENGSVLLIAYEQGQSDLSGCRKDKVAKLLSHYEEKHQVSILNAPPMLVRIDGQWQAHARAGLKTLIEAGQLQLDTDAYNLRCQTLGEWRKHAISPIKDMWMKPIVERLLAV